MMSAARHLRTNIRGLYITFAALVILAGSVPIWATLVCRLTDEDLVKYATVICEGRVTDIRCEWNTEHNQIHTVVTIALSTLLKGKLAHEEKQTLTLRLLGGTVGDEAMIVVDGPVFKKGEEVILFLDRDRCPLMPIVGLFQGKLSIETDEKTETKTVKGRRTATGASVSRDKFVANVQRLIKGEKPLIEDEGAPPAGQIGVLQDAKEFRLYVPAPFDPWYLATAPHDGRVFFHWDLREFLACYVPWVMGTAWVPDLNANGTANEAADRTLAKGTFTSAFNAWDEIWPSQLHFEHKACLTPPAGNITLGDAYNALGFGTLPVGTFAVTEHWLISNLTGVLREADIVFNDFRGPNQPGIWVFAADREALARDVDNPPTGDFPGPNDVDWNGNEKEEVEIDLLSVALHEAGHFVGLAHCWPTGGGYANNPNHPLMESIWGDNIGDMNGGWANQTLKDQDKDGCMFL